MKYVKFYIFVVLIACQTIASRTCAQERLVSLDGQFHHTSVHTEAEVMVTNRNAQLSDILKAQNWQHHLPKEPLNPDQSLWLRVTLLHQQGADNHFTLSISNPTIDYIDLYALDDLTRIIRSYKTGAKRNFSQRPYSHRDFLMPLELPTGQPVDIYLRIIDDGPIAFPLQLWRTSAFVEQEQKNLAMIGMIAGALAILFCYFLISYVLLRSPIRFWFAVASGFFLLLLLNIQGIISQFIGNGSYISSLTTILVALVLFASAKVSHAMLLQVPSYWRGVSYVFAGCLFLAALILTTYWQIIVAVGLAGASLVVHLLLAVLFHNRFDSMPNRVYSLGWIIISTAALFHIGLYLSGVIFGTEINLVFVFLMLVGVLLIAVAIEAHEQVLAQSRQQLQLNTISNLHQFYNLFQNSAEGLYTSTPEGRLITTNPAMCNLFGFDNQEQMLAEVSSTAEFYANEHDREALIEEIETHGKILGREIKGVRRDGSEFWFSISVQIREEGGQKFMFGSIFDITERKQSNTSLEYLATHDPLTGVHNRREFEVRLRRALDNAQANQAELTLLYMDLDQFKLVNDTCGHKAGDVLIKQLAQQLNAVVSKKGLLARLGGDEFGVLLEGEEASVAYLIANKLLNVVQEFRFIWDNRIFSLGISIGLVSWRENAKSPEQFLSMADAACYMAKEQGRNQIHTYSELDENMQRYESELQWVSHINDALEQDKFELFYQHYQPLRDKVEGHHYEILLRLRDEEGNIVPPAAFFPAAERYNLTAPIDRWVIEHCFRWLSSNPEHMAALTRCNINLSGNSLGDKELKLYVMNAFEKYGIAYQKICFEITESMAIVKMEETLDFIKTFKGLGCSFALDDFGSGFSSYAYLKNLPVDFVKIDGSFVKDLLVDHVDMAMVNSINDIAKAMKMKTVAEFVETTQIMEELKRIGVDYAQGYGVAKPTSLDEFKPHQS